MDFSRFTSAALHLNFSVVDEATNPAPALNDQWKGKGKGEGEGEAGIVASSTNSSPISQLAHSIRTSTYSRDIRRQSKCFRRKD